MRRSFLVPSSVILSFCCLFLILLQSGYQNESGVVMKQPAMAEDSRTLHLNQKKKEITSEMRHQSLSMHIVSVPFLQYPATEAKLTKRLLEYKHVLKQNLAHPFVKKVHILTTNYTDGLRITEDVPNKEKLIVVERKSEMFKDSWEYISENLVGEDVMFANADIYLGSGFEKVSTLDMDTEKIMYALSRRVAPDDMCGRTKDGKPRSVGITDTDICLSGRYFGSHDVFLFRLKEPLPQEFLDALNFELGSLGQENVVIWLFQTKLGYCVLNPCSILQVFHYHCSGVRNRESKVRVSNAHNTGRSPYTEHLLCSTKTSD